MGKHYYECLLELPVHLLETSYKLTSICDPAHNEEHIRAVVRMADSYLDIYPEADRNSVILAALMHDLGCYKPEYRTLHEEYSAHIAIDLLQEYVIDCDINKVITAILQHRASFKGERTLLEAKLIASSDRGLPELEAVYTRAYLYSKNLVGQEAALVSTVKHMTEKFGEGGYGRYSKDALIMSRFSYEVREFESQVPLMTINKLRDMVVKNGAW